jgi:hypothetical protein
MHQRFMDRMEEHLKRLAASAQSGRLRDAGVAHERLGRLRERYWRGAGAFDVRIAPLDKPDGRSPQKLSTGRARLSITWTRNPRWNEWAELSDGCYLLRTNLPETDPARLWKWYIQLTEAEWAFRIHKDELEIRPVWHQKSERVQAHILVCFLAYVLWKTLAQWMRGAGLGDAPRTVVEEFARIKSGDVVLPTRTADGRPGKTIRVRCVTTPDPAQKVLLNRLGLTVPQHLRYMEEVEQM